MTANMKPQGKQTEPWYRQLEHWSQLADKYVMGSRQLWENELYFDEIVGFIRVSTVRLIFESNLLEHAGPSRGETRRIIEEAFPHIPSEAQALRELARTEDPLVISGPQIANMLQVVNEQESAGRRITPSYSFGKRSRSVLEVLRHHHALYRAFLHVLGFRKFANLRSQLQRGGSRASFLEEFYPQEVARVKRRPPKLLSQPLICNLHKIMAEGLLPGDAGVDAGEYRIDNRTVDYEVVFPSPKLIQPAMRKYVRDSNALILSPPMGMSVYEIAARISYDFVRIHPFPDFNGRMSRLILAMALYAKNIPFHVSLLGNKKERHRYMTALRRANRGDLRPYSTLIAMRTALQFAELDENLKRAGLGSLLDFASKARNKK